jgi:hypothetical protein
MRRFGIAVIAAVMVTFGGVALANSRSGASSDDERGEVIELYAPTVQFAFIDLGDKGFSLGDQFVFSDDLLTEKGGKHVGFDGGVCTVVRVTDAKAQSGNTQCLVTFSLSDGQITTQDLHTLTNGNLTGTQPGAITGGTGRFREARGDLDVAFASNTEATITLSLE